MDSSFDENGTALVRRNNGFGNHHRYKVWKRGQREVAPGKGKAAAGMNGKLQEMTMNGVFADDVDDHETVC